MLMVYMYTLQAVGVASSTDATHTASSSSVHTTPLSTYYMHIM